MIMKLIILGAFATGKGTQAAKLADHLGLQRISTGDMFREEIRKRSDIGLKVKGILDRGDLVPDDLTVKILKERLPKESFILDGFPRTVRQAEELGKIRNIDLVINLDVTKEEIVRRATGRLTCRAAGHIYHEIYEPPKDPGKCDIDGSDLYKREDQKPEAVESRFQAYEKNTKPLIEYYQRKGLLVNVNGMGTPDEVFNRILIVLKG